jgi:hypothetical protein
MNEPFISIDLNAIERRYQEETVASAPVALLRLEWSSQPPDWKHFQHVRKIASEAPVDLSDADFNVVGYIIRGRQ